MSPCSSGSPYAHALSPATWQPHCTLLYNDVWWCRAFKISGHLHMCSFQINFMKNGLPQQKADRLMEGFQDCVHQQLILILGDSHKKHQIPYEFVEDNDIVKNGNFGFDCK